MRRSVLARAFGLAALAVIVGCSSGGTQQPPPTSDAGKTSTPITLPADDLGDTTVGVAYSHTLTATGGTAPLAYAATGLPAGITLSSAGAFAGTATASGDFQVAVTVTDAAGTTASQTYPFKVYPGVSFTTTSLPDATAGAPYAQGITVAGGKAPVAGSITAGSLPAGLTFDGGAFTITGSAADGGSASFTVQAQDAHGATATQAFSFAIAPALDFVTSSLPNGNAGTAYATQTLQVTGGKAPLTFSVTSGVAPAGLTLSSGGSLSGTPTSAGGFDFTVSATDANAASISRAFHVDIYGNGAPTVSTSTLPNGVVGASYTASLQAANGQAPFSWTVSSGTLPAGLSLASDGTLSGSPTTAGNSSFTVQVTDSNAQAATKSLTLAVFTPLVIGSAALNEGYVGQAYAQTLAASGGQTPYTWSATGLPPGVTLSTGGILSGSPTQSGSYGVVLTVSDGSGQSVSAPLTAKIYDLPSVANTSLADGVVGASYSQLLTASGGKSPYTFTATGSLPAGLVLVSGVISGTPTAAGTSTFVVTVADANGQTAQKALTIAVYNGLAITASNPPDGYVGQSYSQTLSSSGGRSPFSWSVTGGGLPAGLSLDASTGALIGTPTAAGTASFIVQVSDADGQTASKSFTLAVYSAPSLTATLADGYVSQAYARTLSATGGKSPLSYTVSSGSLPTGVNLSTGGVLSGTPSVAGTATFTVTVTDANNQTGSVDLTLAVYALPAVSTTSLADGYVGGSYSQTLASSGGKAPITWTITSGGLPAGVSLSGSTLSGSPTTANTASFTATATDANGRTASQPLTISVFNAPAISTSALADGTVNVTYSEALQASGGKAPLSWTVVSGNLPAGISLASSGALSGSPTATGTQTFTVQVTDANGVTATKQLSISVYGSVTITTTSLPDAYVSVSYTQSLQAAGGKSPYTWALSSGSLPPGLTLSGAGALSGTPTTAGTYSFTVQVTDSNNLSTTQVLSLNEVAKPTIATATLPDGYVGASYSQTVAGQNGAPPYSFAITTGTLPAGLALDTSSGTLSGAPTTAGSSTFKVTLTDSNGLTASQSYTVGVYAAPQISTSSPLNDAYVGVAFLQTLAVTGGKSPFTWSVASGSPPTGLSLDSGGNLSGTATTASSSAFSVKVTDANGKTATKAFTQAVLNALAITTTSVPDGYVGIAYASTSIGVSGGKSPYGFTVTSGALPGGLTLSSSGTLSGQPTTANTSVPFTITVTDGNGTTASQSFTAAIYNPPSVTTSSLSDAYAGTAYTAVLSETGGKSGLSWSVSAGSLPAGVSLSSSGTLSGTTSSTGTFTFTAQVTDANGVSGTKSLTLNVLQALSLTTTSLPDGYTGSTYSGSLAASGGKTSYTYAATPLPAGLTLNTSTGAITGTPTSAGTTSVAAQVTDANGATASKTLSIVVYAPPSITTASLADAYVGSSYSTSIAGSGGKTPYSFAVASGLPPGISLSSGGSISGTPTTNGAYTFSVTLTDANGKTATASLTITVLGALTVTNGSLPDAYTSGAGAYSATLTETGGKANYTWSINADGGLPAGLSLTASTGAIGGTATTVGTSNFVATVTDGNGTQASKALSIAVLNPPSITTTSLADGYPSTTYSATLAGTGGRTPYTFSAGTGLPPGVTLGSSGSFSGTPTTAGTYNFTVTIADANNVSSTKSETIIVRSTLAITTTSLPDGYLTQSYSQTLAATGGKTSYTWSIGSGSLPAGLNLAQSTGAITGTPTAAGTSSFTVVVTDANGATASQSLTIQTYALPSITTSSLSDAYQGSSYSVTLASSGGKPTLSWAVTSGTPPTGLSLSSAGVLSGTVGASATSQTFTVTLTDANNKTATATFTVNVLAGFNISTSSINDGYVSSAFSQSLVATGGATPYTWTASGLPTWLSLSSAGVLSGTPTTTGTFSFSVSVKDNNNSTASNAPKSYSVTVYNSPSVTTSSLADAYNTRAYNQTLAVSGGKSPFTWSITAGTLPSGLSLTASTGAISGTPSATTGTSSVTFKVTDANGVTSSATLGITVYNVPSITTSALADGYTGTAYSQTQALSGGKSPFTWSLSSGTLQSGLTYSTSTGTISGTPTATGTASLTFTVTDANGITATKSYSLSIYSPLSVTTSSLADGYLTVAYSQTLASSGGKPTVTWTSTGTLPPGITLTSSGTLSGTPTTAGTYSFSVTATDADNTTATKTLSILVHGALSISTTSLKDAYRSSSYSASVSASGGKSPYSFSVSSGSLPSGITLGSDGTLSGTVSATAATQSFVVTVTDANNTTATQNLSITVYDNPSVTTTSLSDGYQSKSYPLSGQNATLAASGGKSPVTWSITGSLPSGLSLTSSSGVIGGTVGASATSQTFTAVATDANGVTASKSFTISVYAVPSITTSSLSDAYVGSSYSTTIAASGGKPSLTWSLTAGSLPPGLTLNSSNGALSGTVSNTVTNGQSFSFTITVTDADSQLGSKSLTLATYFAPSVAVSLGTATEGVTYMVGPTSSAQIAGTNGKTPYTYAVSGLPSGLSMSTAGIISGIPSQGDAAQSPYAVTFQVTDANGMVATDAEKIAVIVPPAQLYGGTLGVEPTGSPITDQLTVYVYDQGGLPWPNAGVRIRKNGAEYATTKQALTDSTGKAWFSGLGLNGTTDTVDITVNHPLLTTTTYAQVNAAVVTVMADRYQIPRARTWPSGTFDTSLNKLLVGMGRTSANYISLEQSFTVDYNDLCELVDPTDGGSWSELIPPGMSTSPSTREEASFANAGVSGATSAASVLFGGKNTSGTAYSDTWVYNSSSGTWSQSPSTGPSARYLASMAPDGTGHGVIMFGGEGTIAGAQGSLSDLWHFDTTTSAWNQLDAGSLSARYNASAAYVPTTGEVYFCGGIGSSLDSDCAAYKPSTGSWRTLGSLPSARQGMAMAATPSGTVYGFGGATSTSSTTNTFLSFNGTTWNSMGASGPAARTNAVLAWDSTRNLLILFGGNGGTGYTRLEDTWTFNPTTNVWTQVGPYLPASPTTYSLSGTITNGSTDPNSNVTILATGQSGWESYAFVSVGSSNGSGSYTLSNIPAGDTITVTALNTIDATPQTAYSFVDLGVLGPFNANTTQNISFPSPGPATVQLSGSVTYPSGWALGASSSEGSGFEYRSGFGSFWLQDSNSNLTTASSTWAMNYFAPATGLTEDAQVFGQNLAAGACEQSTVVALGTGSGTYNATLPTPPRSLGVGLAECAPGGYAGLGNDYNWTVGSGGSAQGTASGDINGDGVPDLVIVNSTGVVDVVYGDGTGNSTSSAYAAQVSGASLIAVAVGDLNGDGRADIVFSNSTSSLLEAVLSTSTGFSAPITLTSTQNALSIALADFNSDGHLDIAWTDSMGYLNVAYGSGNGTVSSTQMFQVSAGGFGGNPARSVVATDYNGDGKTDLACVSPDGYLYLFANVGGSFGSKVSYYTGTGNPGALGAGDFNKDGKIDFAVADRSSGQVGVMLQNTGGSFSSATFLYTGLSGADSMAVADYNGDGYPDVAVGSTTASQIVVASGSATGTLSTYVTYYLPSTGGGVTTADFNGDGRADLAAGGPYQAEIYLQHTTYPKVSDTTFTATVTAPTTGNVSLIQLVRSPWGGMWDFMYWGPSTTSALSISPPLTSTLTTGRTPKSGQTAAWSVSQTLGTSSNVNWNNIYLSQIRESSSTKTGAHIYTRQ